MNISQLGSPSTTYVEQSYLVKKWDINGDPFTKYTVIEKTFLPLNEQTNIWLDKFHQLFPQKIINDAKRISFDYENKGISPSNVAIRCLYLSCEFHDQKDFFENNISVIGSILNSDTRTQKRTGLRHKNVFLFNVRQKAEDIKEAISEEKWKVLENIKGLE